MNADLICVHLCSSAAKSRMNEHRPDTALRSAHLVKNYGRRRVVDDVSLQVEKGEVVGLLGANGAGKTTTFYMIVGLERPDSGNVLLGGQDLTNLPMYLRARLGIGYLPQEPSVFRKMTTAQKFSQSSRPQVCAGANNSNALKSCWKNLASVTCVTRVAMRCRVVSGVAPK